MRSKRTFQLLGVIVAILLMVVGYAAIQDLNFSVVGNASSVPNSGSFKVIFTGTPTYSGTGTADLAITGERTATMSVSGLKSVGDKLTATFTIANLSSDLMAYLSDSITNSNPEYFKVTSSLGSTILDPQTGTTNLNITLELIKSPITESQSVDLTVTVNASPFEPESGNNTILGNNILVNNIIYGNNIIGNNVVGNNIVGNTIVFKIDGTTYYAEEGMTWAEWCESSYNTSGKYYYYYDRVTTDGNLYMVCDKCYSYPATGTTGCCEYCGGNSFELIN